MTSRLDSSSSVSRGAGRFEDGIVWASTAAHSAVRPTLSFRLTSMPRSISAPATSKWPFISARTRALCRSGSTSSMLALPSTSAATHEAQPSRAASSSAVKPPGGSHLSRGSWVRWRCHSTTVDRVLGSAPASISIAIIGTWPCAAAHISGVCPRQLSPASSGAPRATSTLAAATSPLRAQVWSAVSPSGPVAVAGTPASSSRVTSGALPISHASWMAVTP